jgi:hypothetical protein
VSFQYNLNSKISNSKKRERERENETSFRVFICEMKIKKYNNLLVFLFLYSLSKNTHTMNKFDRK